MTVYSVVKFGERFVVTADKQAVISFEDAASAVEFAHTIVDDDKANALTVEAWITKIEDTRSWRR